MNLILKLFLFSALFLNVAFSPAQDLVMPFQNESVNYQTRPGENKALTLVFVHGWCIDKSYWEAQVQHFSGKYPLVYLDLPGLKEAPAYAHQTYSIEAYAQLLDAFIKRLELSNVLLIGHSFASDIVLETALLNDQVRAIVGVDAFKELKQSAGEETQSEIDAFFKMLETDFSSVVSAYADQALFAEQTNTAIKERVRESFVNCSSANAIASLKSTYSYFFREGDQLKKLQQKLFLINSDYTPTDQQAFKNLGISAQFFTIEGAGHYPMIERPRQFNEHLEKIIRELTRP